DLDRVDRRPAEADRDAHRVRTVIRQPEESDRALRLAVRRPADVEHIVQAFDLDRPGHAEVGPGAAGEFALQRDLHGHGAALDRRIDPHDPPLDHAVARVDQGRLAHGHVTDQRLGNPQDRLEPTRLGDPRDRGAGHDPLPDLEVHLLEDAGRPRPDLHRLDLTPLELRDRAEPLDLLALHGELVLDRIREEIEPLPLDLETDLQLRGTVARVLEIDLGDQPLLRQLLVRPDLAQRLLVLPLDRGDRGLLRESLRLQIRPQAHELRFRRRERLLGLQDLDVHVGVAQLEDDRALVDLDPGPDMDPLDPAGRQRRDPAHVLRDQVPMAPDLPHHRAAADRVREDQGAVDPRRGRLQPGERQRDQRDRRDARADEDVAAPLWPLLPWNVHLVPPSEPPSDDGASSSPPLRIPSRDARTPVRDPTTRTTLTAPTRPGAGAACRPPPRARPAPPGRRRSRRDDPGPRWPSSPPPGSAPGTSPRPAGTAGVRGGAAPRPRPRSAPPGPSDGTPSRASAPPPRPNGAARAPRPAAPHAHPPQPLARPRAAAVGRSPGRQGSRPGAAP